MTPWHGHPGRYQNVLRRLRRTHHGLTPTLAKVLCLPRGYDQVESLVGDEFLGHRDHAPTAWRGC